MEGIDLYDYLFEKNTTAMCNKMALKKGVEFRRLGIVMSPYELNALNIYFGKFSEKSDKIFFFKTWVCL